MITSEQIQGALLDAALIQIQAGNKTLTDYVDSFSIQDFSTLARTLKAHKEVQRVVQGTSEPFKVSPKKLGQNRGQSRLWIEGAQLLKCGFVKGGKAHYHYSASRTALIIRPSVQGQITVSGKQKAGKTLPIIDINNQELTDYFKGAQELQIEFYINKVIVTVKA